LRSNREPKHPPRDQTAAGPLLLAAGALWLAAIAKRHPENMPWTALDLAQPVGTFTGRKLAALDRDGGGACKALLDRAGIRFNALPPRSGGEQCGYTDGVRLTRGGALDIGYQPAGLGTSCPVAAAMALVGMACRPAGGASPSGQQGPRDRPFRKL
jgi:hypothetical protein